MTILQPSSILTPYSGRTLPAGADLSALLLELRNALSSTGLDSYERSYAQTWLTGLFNKCQNEAILDEVGDLLMLLTPAGGPKTNRHGETYCFDSPDGQKKIHIEETYMDDVHATGFCTWSSAILLARRMLADPQYFFTSKTKAGDRSLKVLELGSGTGLAGIAAYKALQQLPFVFDLVLSDMDEKTIATSQQNLANNGCLTQEGAVRAKVTRLDWNGASQSSLGPFDVIIGADIVYEPEHGQLILQVVRAMLARRPESVFHLVVVLRPTHTKDIETLEALFHNDGLSHASQLVITEQEDIDEVEESPYPYQHRRYEIRWRNLPS